MADGKLMILCYQSRTECTRYTYAAKSMFAAPSITLESDESVNGAATDRGRERGGRRIEPAELVRFNRDRRSGAKPHSHTRPGTGETGGARGEASAVGLSCAGTPPHRECDHAQAGRQCTCAMAKAGYLAACFTTTRRVGAPCR